MPWLSYSAESDINHNRNFCTQVATKERDLSWRGWAEYSEIVFSKAGGEDKSLILRYILSLIIITM